MIWKSVSGDVSSNSIVPDRFSSEYVRMVIIGSKPASVYGEDPTFKVNPQEFMRQAQEIHGSRYVNNEEIERTLLLVKHRKIKAVVNRTFPLEEAEQVHELLRKNAIAGRAALIVS